MIIIITRCCSTFYSALWSAQSAENVPISFISMRFIRLINFSIISTHKNGVYAPECICLCVRVYMYMCVVSVWVCDCLWYPIFNIKKFGILFGMYAALCFNGRREDQKLLFCSCFANIFLQNFAFLLHLSSKWRKRRE